MLSKAQWGLLIKVGNLFYNLICLFYSFYENMYTFKVTIQHLRENMQLNTNKWVLDWGSIKMLAQPLVHLIVYW